VSGVNAIAVSVPKTFAAFAVKAITVGRYSGGYGEGTGLAAGDAKGEQPTTSPRREARIIKFRFMRMEFVNKSNRSDVDLLDL
jgi:hypothetical protein